MLCFGRRRTLISLIQKKKSAFLSAVRSQRPDMTSNQVWFPKTLNQNGLPRDSPF
jgi:hypothetical protein